MKHFSMKHFFDAARMFGVAAVVVLVAGCASTLPPPHEVGRTYRDVFPVSATASGASVPLPPGEWELFSYTTDRGFGGDSVTGVMTEAMLVQTKGNQLSRFVYIFTNQGRGKFYWDLRPHGCFAKPDSHNEKWIMHTERIIDANAGESSAHDC